MPRVGLAASCLPNTSSRRRPPKPARSMDKSNAEAVPMHDCAIRGIKRDARLTSPPVLVFNCNTAMIFGEWYDHSLIERRPAKPAWRFDHSNAEAVPTQARAASRIPQAMRQRKHDIAITLTRTCATACLRQRWNSENRCGRLVFPYQRRQTGGLSSCGRS